MNGRPATTTIMLLTAAALAAAVVLPARATAAGPVRCGHLRLHTAIGAVNARISQRRSTCAEAKRVARRYSNAPTSRCRGNSCFMEWADGWSCASTNGTVWQQTERMFTCEKARARVYAHARYPADQRA